MRERVSNLTPEDRAYLDHLRAWVRGHLGGGSPNEFDKLECKLFLVQEILQKKLVGPDEGEKLQALGVVFGDALAQQNGLDWVIVQYDGGRNPELSLPKTTLRINAFQMIHKRVTTGEEFDVRSLFDATCHSIKKIKTELTGSFLSRVSQRIAGAFRG